jgi:hypothetical protein
VSDTERDSAFEPEWERFANSLPVVSSHEFEIADHFHRAAWAAQQKKIDECHKSMLAMDRALRAR